MKEYKRVQIIKHALQVYVKREGATERDISEEKKVLDEYTERANMLKEQYKIK